MNENSLIAYVPLSAIKLETPPDGFPSIQDFVTTTISFIFNGSRLYREPIDLTIDAAKDDKFSIKKGFTRLKPV